MRIAQVALDIPLYRLFDYAVTADTKGAPPETGRVIRVPFGRGEKTGLIVALKEESGLPPEQIRAAHEILEGLPALPPDFFRLCEFASAYYQAPLGETLLGALPPELKKTRTPKRRQTSPKTGAGTPSPPPVLTFEQQNVLGAVLNMPGYSPILLHGVTGSGKTEVYMRLIAAMLEKKAQVLLLTPEINLTPQLETRIRQRFPETLIAVLHSDLTGKSREEAWKAGFSGLARIIIGTRLAVFTPLPDLGLIIVDEEHDPSYKQHDGIRYSARDLAVFRAYDRKIPIILGSATPSLESWSHARQGRYTLLSLKERAISDAKMPATRLVDTRRTQPLNGFSQELLEALDKRLKAGEQSLVFLNRRGYAPVLSCVVCGWLSQCSRCAANMVLHLKDQRLRCHHCGLAIRIPKACPVCGNQDVRPFGYGTQRLEATLAEIFQTARILRIDRDSVKSRKQWETLSERIHDGGADILLGTQMLAKGHDFPRLTLVGIIGADAALFSANYRAPERLFAQIMQVSGRAGRATLPGEVIIQTQYPEHPLYQAILSQNYPGYADTLLSERRTAGFPPYTFQAILRAEAPQMENALSFLKIAAQSHIPEHYPQITLYDPVPMHLARLCNLERAQLLIESPVRNALQAFLAGFRESLQTIKTPARLRWHLEVDPLEF